MLPVAVVPPGTVIVAVALPWRVFLANRPVDELGAVVPGPVAVGSWARLGGSDPPPGATAQAWPVVAALAPVSWTAVVDEELMLTGAWLVPSIWTAASAVWLLVFWAVRPVAELLPELAVVTPEFGVGSRATLRPVWALAAPLSWTEVVFWLCTASGPEPPPATPAEIWVVVLFVCA